MNSEKRKALSIIIDNIAKITTSFCIIIANLYLCILAQTGRVAELKEDSLSYQLCSLVWNEATFNAAQKDRDKKVEELAKSVENHTSTQSNENLIDLFQTENQRLLSIQINDRNKKIENIEKSSTRSYGWIYVGSIDNRSNVWITKYFQFNAPMPEINKQYIIDKAINVRESAPSKESGKWQKGKVIGGLIEGDTFVIEEICNIPGTNFRSLIWAKIIRY